MREHGAEAGAESAVEASSDAGIGLAVTLPAPDGVDAAPPGAEGPVGPAPGTASLVLVEELPLALEERFEFIEFLGQGAMGTVYRAKDRRLGRDVAIKLIRGGDAKTGWRFLQEVRAQARIEHEHVCKVFEIGSASGVRFIVMQLIHGAPLDKAKETMTTEQKVKVVKEAAEALHEAHRAGFIHRDIKPGNIMVEISEDGACKPYVMDFGLARDLAGWDQTMTGTIVGTPAFMAPEQARGENRTLDRRTDVYSLGATLYDLLAGRPPFMGESVLELLRSVGHDDARPLRETSHAIPEDLETVVMKCLEREPHRRYDSARALAEDLQRYLDGEPVNARRASIGYVLGKRVKKHKLAVALLTAALVGSAVLVSLWIRGRNAAAERARLSQELGADVKEMELFLRYAHGLPLHDIEQEREVVRRRLGDIEARRVRIGHVAEGPGHYALGRGYLSLQEPETALVHLRASAIAGYHSPDLAYATGRALGELYKEALEEARRIEEPVRRQARLQQIEADYRDPALQHLRAAVGAQLEAPEYVEGLLAFYEGRHDEALGLAKKALARSPWLYEAEELLGDIHFTEGSRWRVDAEFDYEKMMEHFTKAAEAYHRASAMARSDPTIYLSECELWIQRVSADFRHLKTYKESFEQAKSTCDKAVLASSRSGAARIKRARAYAAGSWYSGANALDPDVPLIIEKAIEFAEDAAKSYPDDAMAQYTLGVAWMGKVSGPASAGLDKLQAAEKAVAAYEKATALAPQFLLAVRELGLAYSRKAVEEHKRGLDASVSLKRALEQFERTAPLAPPSFVLHLSDACKAYGNWMRFLADKGKSPKPLLERTLQACEAASARTPGSSNFAVSGSYQVVAAYEIASGADPSEALERATKAVETMQKSSSWEQALGVLFLAEVYGYKALYALQKGEDPEPSLEKARETNQRAASALPKADGNSPRQRARIELVALRWAMKNGKATPAHFEAALKPLRPFVEMKRVDPDVACTMAAIHERRGAWLLEGGKSPDEDVARGLDFIDKAISQEPHDAQALATRGGLLLVRARAARESSASARTQRMEAARLAKEAFASAFRENPLLDHEHGPAMREAEQLLAEKR